MKAQGWMAGAGAGVALVLVLLLLLPTLNLLDSPFSAYESGPEDTSVLVNAMRAQGFEVASLTLGPTGLQGLDPARTNAIYLATGVDRGYTGPELDRLFAFVEQGGRAVILDDSGASQSLLDRLDVTKGSFLLATTGDQASVVPVQIGANLVNLWEPVELVPGEDADVRVLARAENTTAKDSNGNGQADPEEPTCNQGCAVAIEANVGEGSLVFVADPTFATNEYATGSGVIPLLQSLAAQETSTARAILIVDESRHVVGPSEVGLTLFRTLLVPLGYDLVPWTLAGLLLLITIISVVRRREGTWADHDPAMDAPYLPEDALEPDDDAAPHGGEPA